MAWRILFLVRLSRTNPDIQLGNILNDMELDAVETFTLKTRSKYIPTTLGDFMLLIAKMGGYEDRKDRIPGPKVIRRGLEKFFDYQSTRSFEALKKSVDYKSLK